jgi:Fe2+ transport system protein B
LLLGLGKNLRSSNHNHSLKKSYLNLADEAKRYGVQIDIQILGERLELPVYAISAKHGIGCDRVLASLLV